MDDYIADSVQAKKLDGYYNFTLLYTDKTGKLAGLPGYDISYVWSCCHFSNKLLDREIGTIIGDEVYFVTYSAQVELYSAHLETINKMSDSLEIDIPQSNATKGLQEPNNSNAPDLN